jgi:purine-binding chemotaxis protein CheW
MGDDTTSNLLQLMGFKLDDHYLGIDIIKVKTIEDLSAIMPLSSSYSYYEKPIILQGEMLQIINLRAKLRLPDKAWTDNYKIIVLDSGATPYGFIIDELNGIIRIAVNPIPGNPGIIDGMDSNFISAACKYENHLLAVLDVDKLLSSL